MTTDEQPLGGGSSTTRRPVAVVVGRPIPLRWSFANVVALLGSLLPMALLPLSVSSPDRLPVTVWRCSDRDSRCVASHLSGADDGERATCRAAGFA